MTDPNNDAVNVTDHAGTKPDAGTIGVAATVPQRWSAERRLVPICVSRWARGSVGILFCALVAVTALSASGRAALLADRVAQTRAADRKPPADKTAKSTKIAAQKEAKPAAKQKPAKSGATSDEVTPAENGTKTEGGKTASQKSHDSDTDFVRFRTDDKDEPVALETAVSHYEITSGPFKGAKIDLIGAIHIGEKSYYEQLNRRFTKYEAVLYELVASEKARVPDPTRRKKSQHPITVLQKVMRDVLELDFQLDRIDYGKPNLVHADMSPTEFAQTMKDRGESFMQMFFRMMGQAMRMQMTGKDSGPNEMQLLVALFSRNRALKLKQLLAREFQDVELQTAALSGPDGSTIITERNKKALSVLQSELKKGKRHLGIFYGAGHLPDMESRLIKDFAAKRVGQEWLVAWALQ